MQYETCFDCSIIYKYCRNYLNFNKRKGEIKMQPNILTYCTYGYILVVEL